MYRVSDSEILNGHGVSKFVGDDITDEDMSEYYYSTDDEYSIKQTQWNEDATINEDITDGIGNDVFSTVYDEENMLECNTTITNREALFAENKWKMLLSSIGVHKNPHEMERADLIGRVFKDLEDAEFFFNQYAKYTGFSVRKGHMRRRKNGLISLREWKCSCEGHRDEKYLKMVNRRREARALTRVGCQVLFRVIQKKRCSEWIVKEFITEHCHRLATPAHIQFLRSNKVILGGDLQMAKNIRSAGIRTCHIMTYMAQQSGGYDNMSYIIKDLYNHIGGSKTIQLSDIDASRAMGYFEHKADHDGGFFGKYSYDEDRRLGNVVWADSRCQSDYACFGEAIAFDTTYRTNGYGKSLLIWIGINNHFRTTVLGFAILVNETLETYKWVTAAFLECMNGVIPKTVVTDGDLTIRGAIVELMPNAKHRLCSWHIERKDMVNVKDPEFLARMKKMIFRYFSEEKFDIEWFKMVNDFGLQRNAWVKMMYERRKTLAETFL